jgi:hypothetical protein
MAEDDRLADALRQPPRDLARIVEDAVFFRLGSSKP